MVVFNAVEEKIAGLLEKGVYRQIKGVKVEVEWCGVEVRVLFERCEARGKVELLLNRGCWQLVEERGEDV